jgi:hypothetical protein
VRGGTIPLGLYDAGGSILLDRFTGLCRELGPDSAQASELFHSLPRGSQQAAWDDLRRHLVSRGSIR